MAKLPDSVEVELRWIDVQQTIIDMQARIEELEKENDALKLQIRRDSAGFDVFHYKALYDETGKLLALSQRELSKTQAELRKRDSNGNG